MYSTISSLIFVLPHSATDTAVGSVLVGPINSRVTVQSHADAHMTGSDTAPADTRTGGFEPDAARHLTNLSGPLPT